MSPIFNNTAVVSSLALSRGRLDLKAAATFYDDVIVVDGAFMTDVGVPDIVGQDFDILEENGILRIHKYEFHERSDDPRLFALGERIQSVMAQSIFTPTGERYDYLHRLAGSGMARLLAAKLSFQDGSRNYVPIVFDASDGEALLKEIQLGNEDDVEVPRTASALNLVFQRVPAPKETTPWEAILSYRQEEGMWSLAYQLRQWVAKHAANESGPALAEALRYELEQLEKRMKIHDLAVCHTTFSATLPFFDLLGNLATLKFGQALKPLVDAQKAKLTLMQAEEKISSEPLYMIAHAKRRLS